jgi:DNA mismatch repair protein MutS2
VAEIREDRVMVEAGSIRLEVPLTELEPIDGGAGAAASPSATPNASAGASAGGRGWTGPDREGGRIEVDLRGLRIHELEVQLARALDEAVLDDLPELRIIHGKGTGALRQRVGELLRADRRVKTSRMGGPTEGGAGVTIAGFREPS